jgi:hypothetical protein
MLWDQQELEIRARHWELLSKNVAMLHDYAHLHSAADTIETLHQLNMRWWYMTWLTLTVTCLVHSKTLWEATISPDKEMRKQHMCGMSRRQTHILSEGLWTAGLSVLKKIGAI